MQKRQANITVACVHVALINCYVMFVYFVELSDEHGKSEKLLEARSNPTDSKFSSALQTSQVRQNSMNAQLKHERIALFTVTFSHLHYNVF